MHKDYILGVYDEDSDDRNLEHKIRERPDFLQDRFKDTETNGAKDLTTGFTRACS
jgi:hypothetical protein